jgi:phenylacetate-CoA ligase
MKNSERIYESLPIWLQNVACSATGWNIQRNRYGAEFHSALAEYERRLTATRASLEEFKKARLSEFVSHSIAATPYYRATIPESDSAGAFSSLPVLNKSTVQADIRSFRSESIPPSHCMTHHTSGTTGRGLVFPCTFESQRHQWAVWWRYRRALGIQMDQWCGVFGGRTVVPRSQSAPPFWRINRPARQIIFSGYHLRPDWLDSYINEINRRQVTWLHGYPSHLTLLAQRLIETGKSLAHPVRIITTGAESLLDHQKETIKKAFGCEVRQHYGLAEGVANISECRFGTLHVDEDYSFVEFLPVAGTAASKIVGTNFTNLAFPLLRYDTGDLAFGVRDGGRCPCGREGRTVDRIDGRIEDYIVLKDGTKVGRLDHILKDMVAVREAQFVQRIPGKLVLLNILLRPRPP